MQESLKYNCFQRSERFASTLNLNKKNEENSLLNKLLSIPKI
jgi:hypothetical protein